MGNITLGSLARTHCHVVSADGKVFKEIRLTWENSSSVLAAQAEIQVLGSIQLSSKCHPDGLRFHLIGQRVVSTNGKKNIGPHSAAHWKNVVVM